MIGSSIVRKTHRVFCRERLHRTRVCLPGAKIRDVEGELGALMKSSGRDLKIIVQVGTNDLSDTYWDGEQQRLVGTETILGRYDRLLDRLEQLNCDALVMGILPRFGMSGGMASRIVAINRGLERRCRQRGFDFRDVWEDFAGKREMFAEDGLHPSWKGGNSLGEVYDQWAQVN